jgi:hypothetical protein
VPLTVMRTLEPGSCEGAADAVALTAGLGETVASDAAPVPQAHANAASAMEARAIIPWT